MTDQSHALAESATASRIARELADAIDDALEWLEQIPAERTRMRPRPGGWSAREIIGHLIDSASNNHGRFVRAALGDSMVFPTYDQEAWVALQRYHDEDWLQLLRRWESFNDQVVRAIQHIPSVQLTAPRVEHNLDRVAWKTVPADKPVTLEYLVRDYIGHLRHHLAQISALRAGVPDGAPDARGVTGSGAAH